MDDPVLGLLSARARARRYVGAWIYPPVIRAEPLWQTAPPAEGP